MTYPHLKIFLQGTDRRYDIQAALAARNHPEESTPYCSIALKKEHLKFIDGECLGYTIIVRN